MNDINNKKIEVGDIIYYGKFSEIQIGKVLKIYQSALRVSCARGKQDWGSYRTGKDYTLATENISSCHVVDHVPLKEHNSSKRISVWKADGIKTRQVLIKRKRKK